MDFIGSLQSVTTAITIILTIIFASQFVYKSSLLSDGRVNVDIIEHPQLVALEPDELIFDFPIPNPDDHEHLNAINQVRAVNVNIEEDIPMPQAAAVVEPIVGPERIVIPMRAAEVQEPAANLECSVCFDRVLPGEGAFITRCGHWYHHGSCLTPWFNKGERTCPKCRVVITNDTYAELEQGIRNMLEKDFDAVDKRDLVDLFRHAVCINHIPHMGYAYILNYLKDLRNWDINERFEDGRTMAMIAAQHDNVGALRDLRFIGADMTVVDEYGYDLITLAFIYNSERVQNYLQS